MWGTETSIDTITPESARLMGRSGCRFLYIGLESLAQESLRRSNKRHNQVREYRQRLRYLHDNGVQVMSLFLLGLDGDDPEYLRNLPDLIEDIGVDVPVFSFAAPIEGTPFHASLRDAGQLLPGDILGGHGRDAPPLQAPEPRRRTSWSWLSSSACAARTASPA